MRILFLEHLFLLPADSGGKIKSLNFLKNLAKEHTVRLLSFVRPGDDTNLLPELQKICESVELVPLERNPSKWLLDILNAVATGKSYIISRDYKKDMQSAFNKAVADFNPDVVHIDHLQMAQYLPSRRNYKVVLDQHNVEHKIFERMSQTSRGLIISKYASREASKLRSFEMKICANADLVIAVSEEDRNLMLQIQPSIKACEPVPIGVDVNYYRPFARKKNSLNILSMGTMSWPPNVDAVLYFNDMMFPTLRKDIPGCKLIIAGQNPTAAVWELDSDPDITVTGYLEDTRKLAKDCGVFIVPLRSGSGVRVKILNAMAMGLPIVSTSVGAEGLDVENGRNILIADTPEEFINAVKRVLTDSALAEELGRNARELAESRYSWDIVGRKLLEVYDKYFSNTTE